jgi:fumarate hydratase subunit alpha
MREIHVDEIRDRVAQMCIDEWYMAAEDCTDPKSADVSTALDRKEHTSQEQDISKKRDIGIAVFFVDLGQDIRVKNGFITEAINEGVRKAYREGRFPTGIVDPLTRNSIGDKTPAIVYAELVPGDRLKISFISERSGNGNRNAIRMLDPNAGVAGIRAFVLECVENVGTTACLPAIIGVGIGGDFEKAALLAKKALLRPAGSPNPRLELSSLEEMLLHAANKPVRGPERIGNGLTVMAVHVEIFPCHKDSLPVAVNISSYSTKYKSILL